MNRNVVAGAVLLAICAGAAPGGAQSLAEVARQEEARRKAIASPARIITNDDLPSVPPPNLVTPTSASTSASTPDSPVPAADNVEPASGEPVPADLAPTVIRDEAYWRQRMADARDSLERAQAFQEALQSRLNALATDFVNRDDPAQRAVVASDRARAQAEFDRVTREIVAYEKEIVDAREEARRESVPAGWVR